MGALGSMDDPVERLTPRIGSAMLKVCERMPDPASEVSDDADIDFERGCGFDCERLDRDFDKRLFAPKC